MSGQPGTPRGASPWTRDRFARLSLTVGQVVSCLGCAAGLILLIIPCITPLPGVGDPLDRMDALPGGRLLHFLVLLAASLLAAAVVFGYSAAMYFVFSYVKWSLKR